MFWDQLEDGDDDVKTYTNDDEYYIDLMEKFNKIQSKIFKIESLDYDKPGKHIFLPAISELNGIIDDIDIIIEEEELSDESNIRLLTLKDNIVMFINNLKKNKHVQDV